MAFVWPPKDPNEVLDYQHDWTERLDGDVIQGNPQCILESGDVVIAPATAAIGNFQKVWLSGGTIGDVKLTLRITTAGGRTFDEGIKLKIKER